MCSTSSADANGTDAEISEQLSEMDLSKTTVPTSPSTAYLESILPYEILAKIADFLDNDHDSLESLHFTSKRMAIRFKPLLMDKRKKLFDGLLNWLSNDMAPPAASHNSEGVVDCVDKCAFLLRESEKYLKRVLRTNEQLSVSAHNLPMGGLSLVLLGVSDSDSEESRLSLEERAHKLLTIALQHCYEFSEFYESSVPALIRRFGSMNNLGEDSRVKLEQALARSIFKSFMRKYPILCKFTDVMWPNGMSDDAKKQMAKDYAETNFKTSKFRYSKPRRRGRMFEMRTYGRVGNPRTTKPRKAICSKICRKKCIKRKKDPFYAWAATKLDPEDLREWLALQNYLRYL